jgi:hypothetical protein
VTRLILLAALALGAGQAVAAQSSDAIVNQPEVEVGRLHLRGLDTLNGRVSDIEMRVGETARFGHLEITAQTCRVPRDTPTADAEAFLRIRDVRDPAPRFSGWMFASSPALSALDHPRYDIWVVSCSNS